jgi:hypothetical protein
MTLGLVLSVSAQLLACESRRCVDGDDRVVEDERCRAGFHGGGPYYHWYYGGYGYGHGAYVGGGGLSPGGGHDSVARGGFGARGFGSEGGE